MHIQRRSFLSGLGALIVSPAIVRRGSLMPMRATAHYGSGAVLSAEMIAKEGARLYELFTRGRAAAADPIFAVALTDQFHVAYRDSAEDRQLSIEEYSCRFIDPCVRSLAECVISEGRPLATQSLGHPSMSDVATHWRRNVPLRFASEERIFGDVAWARFDAGVS